VWSLWKPEIRNYSDMLKPGTWTIRIQKGVRTFHFFSFRLACFTPQTHCIYLQSVSSTVPGERKSVSCVQSKSIVFSSSSSSYSITNLGQGGLFRSQLSYRLVVSSVVIQVVVFLLDDNSEVVLGACCLPFHEHIGTTCVCMYMICLLRVWHGLLLKFLRFFCG
jgi:hypothetical protein